MLSGACAKQYIPLKNKVSNFMLLGTDDYPKSQEAVLNMLNHYVSETITQNNLRPAPQEGVAFIQKNGERKAP